MSGSQEYRENQAGALTKFGVSAEQMFSGSGDVSTRKGDTDREGSGRDKGALDTWEFEDRGTEESDKGLSV